MQINPDFNISAYTIRSYSNDAVVIYTPVTEEQLRLQRTSPNHEAVQHTVSLEKPFIVSTTQLIEDWQVEDPQNLTREDFAPILKQDIEILILGTGKRIHFPDPKIQLELQNHGMGLEVMATAAACRTYNFLVSDQRKVAMALFLGNT